MENKGGGGGGGEEDLLRKDARVMGRGAEATGYRPCKGAHYRCPMAGGSLQTEQEAEENGQWAPTYYSQESCGIAAGLFLASVHNMGLTTLTHTPSPMGFLREILGRPEHEHAMLLLPVGFPADEAKVPDLKRKELHEFSEFIE